jgi:hypothetical protein
MVRRRSSVSMVAHGRSGTQERRVFPLFTHAPQDFFHFDIAAFVIDDCSLCGTSAAAAALRVDLHVRVCRTSERKTKHHEPIIG